MHLKAALYIPPSGVVLSLLLFFVSKVWFTCLNHNARVCVLLQIVVQGLPFAYAWQDLKDLFKPLGGVHIAEIVMDRNTGRSRGWGTITFDTESDAQNAIQVSCWCNGNSIIVVRNELLTETQQVMFRYITSSGWAPACERWRLCLFVLFVWHVLYSWCCFVKQWFSLQEMDGKEVEGRFLGVKSRFV